jgi:hypothetical protein
MCWLLPRQVIQKAIIGGMAYLSAAILTRGCYRHKNKLVDVRNSPQIHGEDAENIQEPQNDGDDDYDIEDVLERCSHRDICVYEPHQDPDHNQNDNYIYDWHSDGNATRPPDACLFKLEQVITALDAET